MWLSELGWPHESSSTVWKTLDLENLKLLQKLNYWEMGLQIYISCSYGTYVWCVKTILWYLPWSSRYSSFSGRGSGSSVQVFSENFLTKIGIKLEPTMLQHSFWALWTCIFTPNNLLYYYLALKLTLECDLNGLENGASENHVMIIPRVNTWSLLISKWIKVLWICIMQCLKHLTPWH